MTTGLGSGLGGQGLGKIRGSNRWGRVAVRKRRHWQRSELTFATCRSQQLHLAWTNAFAAMGIPDNRHTESLNFGISDDRVTVAERIR
jgi:hypothetical protein